MTARWRLGDGFLTACHGIIVQAARCGRLKRLSFGLSL